MERKMEYQGVPIRALAYLIVNGISLGFHLNYGIGKKYRK